MTLSETTSWHLIQGAAAGVAGDREQFARRYEPVIRSYLAARWRTAPDSSDVDDATQEVFVRCFREGGVLERVDPARSGGFRPFLYGVIRNVALQLEELRQRPREASMPTSMADAVPAQAESLSAVFDREWARAIMRQAAELQAEHAAATGEGARRRVELLQMRFQEGLPIREIARRWNVDAAFLHHEYAQARIEFERALREVIAANSPGSAAEIDRALAELLAILR